MPGVHQFGQRSGEAAVRGGPVVGRGQEVESALRSHRDRGHPAGDLHRGLPAVAGVEQNHQPVDLVVVAEKFPQTLPDQPRVTGRRAVRVRAVVGKQVEVGQARRGGPVEPDLPMAHEREEQRRPAVMGEPKRRRDPGRHVRQRRVEDEPWLVAERGAAATHQGVGERRVQLLRQRGQE